MHALILLLFSSVAPADSTLMVLRPGEMKSIPVRSREPVRVSSSQVVRVIDKGPRLVLVGRKIGRSIVSHGSGALRIEVVSPPVQETYSAFADACTRMKGLSADVEADQIFIRGRLLRWRDWETLKRISEGTGSRWFMRAAIDPSIKGKTAAELRKIAAVGALPSHQIAFTPYPQIHVSESVMRRVSMQMFAQHYGLELKADPTRLSSDGTIRLRLTFAEVQGDAGERLGIKFNDGQAVQLLPKLQGPDAVSATLLFLANKGQARVLATPSLVARSGTESEFLAGGEFAVRSGNYRKSEVTWKRHGLWLKFKPVLDPRGIVRIDVQTEFSMPDFAGAVDGIPSVRSSRTNSSMDLSLGQTLLLSGLIRSWEGSSWTGLAGFAEIPVIGRLFRSEDFAKNRTELMVFVTPELAASEPESKERDEWD
jgi:hypothetical protein